jgi:hypothetical protein
MAGAPPLGEDDGARLTEGSAEGSVDGCVEGAAGDRSELGEGLAMVHPMTTSTTVASTPVRSLGITKRYA